MGMPLMVTCFLPSGVVMVPRVPVTPSAEGVADVVKTGGHAVRHPPVQALVPESFVSLVK
jgi:hypothetical protein